VGVNPLVKPGAVESPAMIAAQYSITIGAEFDMERVRADTAEHEGLTDMERIDLIRQHLVATARSYLEAPPGRRTR
jgi:hypothetical protein